MALQKALRARIAWENFKRKHDVARIPSRGYCISSDRSSYNACFLSKSLARRGARLLAESEFRSVDLVQVQSHGEERFIIAEITPKKYY